MTAEKDRIIDHRFDEDIQEYDNPVPMWMILIFIVCVVFSVVYVPVYHVFHVVPLPREAYATEAEAAEVARKTAEQKAATADLQAIASDPAAIEQGKQTFQVYCMPCHGANGEGKIGPSLIDATWIHGGQIGDIVKTVTVGVPAKGMPTWGPVLGPEAVQRVAAFVNSLSPIEGRIVAAAPVTAPVAAPITQTSQ